MSRFCLGIPLVVMGCAAQAAFAQTISVSCPQFFRDRHDAAACAEALFSQDNYHFTLASVPPSNGFGPGLVLTKKIGGVAGQSDYVADVSFTGAMTTNRSWYTSGDMNWMLPLPYGHDSKGGLTLGKLKPKSRASLEATAGYREIRTLYYYGNGSGSPNTQFQFGEKEASLDINARMPLSSWLVATGEWESRKTTLRDDTGPDTVLSSFSAASTPGIASQPVYLHEAVGAQTVFTPRISHKFEELPSQDDPHFQSLLLLTLSNNFAYHWQTPTDGSPSAFRQFVYDGDESIQVHQVLRNFFSAAKHPVVRYICNSNKRTDECDFGQIDVKTRLVLTQTSGVNQVPFYLEPTLGGTDVDGRMTLRGWDNYRFRGRDLALAQIEYGFPVYDPIGAFVFYDAGTVGNSASDLSLGRFRQDAGPGLSIRLQGHILIQTFYAFGAGHGGQWNYSFSKSF
jgi:hypothetical protein